MTEPDAARKSPDVELSESAATPAGRDVGLSGSAATPAGREVGLSESAAVPAGPDAGATAPAETPIDSDVDLHVPAMRSELHLSLLAAISAGGVLGALARYALATAWPHPADGFPWSTFVINVTGCFLIGILMVLVTEVVTHRPLLRPFLGVGVLGGYTTFSTYIVDTQRAAGAGAALTALTYLAATLIAALLAVYTGTVLTRAAIHR